MSDPTKNQSVVGDEAPLMPIVHLYLKTSHNQKSIDGSVFFQIIYMYMRAKKNANNFLLDVCLVNPNKIPKEIKGDYSGRLPAIHFEPPFQDKDHDRTISWVDDIDEITRLVEQRFPEPKMLTEKTDEHTAVKFSPRFLNYFLKLFLPVVIRHIPQVHHFSKNRQ